MLGYRSFAIGRGLCGSLAVLGRHSQTRTKRSRVRARSAKPATLIYALGHATFTYLHCGNYAKASAAIDELSALVDETGSLHWKSHVMMNRGWLFAVTGNASDAIAAINSGI